MPLARWLTALMVGATALSCAGVASADTRVVMLGTGTPVPDGDRAGSGVAVVYNDEAYVFDIGAGVVERATQAAERLDIDALRPTEIEHLFITHLHSDHILDFPELIGTYWWRRENPVTVIGPKGTEAMSAGSRQMMAEDTQTRLADKSPVTNPEAAHAVVEEIAEPGVVYDDNGIRISAFAVSHGDWQRAYGYRIETPDKTIVISGDTSVNAEVEKQATGADILVHEVISRQGWQDLPEQWQAYHQYAHTLTNELAELASHAQPDLLVLSHVLHYGAPIESVVDEVRADYDGDVVLADDLDVYD